MEHQNLIWKEENRRTVFRCPVFSVGERICRSPENEARVFTVLDTRDWAIVIPVLEGGGSRDFLMVRQWRHGAGELSLEFPGGVFERGEEPAAAAARELREETAYTAGRLTKLGECSPNPAIMSNRVHFFLAEDLAPAGNQELDEDEFVETCRVPAGEVFQNMGKAPYIHALMGTALSFYLQKPPGGRGAAE
jgi:8-oxo-dGTP pyrophosphatase MutT (NUDIX family)